jgi:ATP-dependent 26S proteasome regulatory subunit
MGNLAQNMKYDSTTGQCAIWSITGGEMGSPGWYKPDGWATNWPDNFIAEPMMAESPHGAIIQAVEYAVNNPTEPWLLIIRDAHTLYESDPWRCAVKDSCKKLRSTYTTLILLTCQSELPDDIKDDLTVISTDLPTVQVLASQSQNTLKQINSKADSQTVAQALKGLGVVQANDAILLDYAEHGTVDPVRLSKIKAQELAKVAGLTFEAESGTLADVGGLDLWKQWLNQRKNCFSPQAKAFGLPPTKGALLIGVPGCGKTLSSRVAANALGVPLISLDLSACEGSLVGQTGERIRQALKVIDSLAPCVLRMDELEKALGASGGGELDGGSKETLRRQLLVWLQDRTSNVFVIATANNISALPPELLRRGRWDATFFVDLPTIKERKEIFNVHLTKRNRSLPDKDIDALAKQSDGYTGAEIEASVIDALWSAFADNERKLIACDIKKALAEVVPLSKIMSQNIQALRQWAKGRAKPASLPEKQPTKPKAQTPQKPVNIQPMLPTKISFDEFDDIN